MTLTAGKTVSAVTIDLPASLVTLRADGIMHFDVKTVNEFMVNDVHDILNAVKAIGKGGKFLNMITIKQYMTFHKEAGALSAALEGNLYTIADAIVVKLTALKPVMNRYITFDKPVRPTRNFTSEEKVIEWLKTFA
jgi:hypothetical protein